MEGIIVMDTNEIATSIVSMLSGESKHRPNESSTSQGYSGGYRGLEVKEEMQGWGEVG